MVNRELSHVKRSINRGQALRTRQTSHDEIDAALARLEKIAENLPAVDVVEIVRQGRSLANDIPR